MRGRIDGPLIDRVDGFHFCGAGVERLPYIGRVEHLPLVGGPGELVQVAPDRPQLLARLHEFGLLGGEEIRAAADEFTDETPQNPGRGDVEDGRQVRQPGPFGGIQADTPLMGERTGGGRVGRATPP